MDSHFKAALLNGSRREILNDLNLPQDQIETIMAIRADTLEQLAREIHLCLVDPYDLEPLSLPVASRTPNTQSESQFSRERYEPL